MNIRSYLRTLVLNLVSINAKPSCNVHILNGHFVEQNLNIDSSVVFENFVKELINFFDVIDLCSAVKLISSNHSCQKPKLAITFDDGFEECYTIMLPILEKYNIKATFFINPMSVENQNPIFTQNFIDKNLKVRLNKRFMNWDMLREINELGHIVGNHSFTHANLKGLTNSKLIYEIADSKLKIETELNKVCSFFAFPFGTDKYFDQDALNFVLENHDFGFTSGNYNKYYYHNNKCIFSRRHFECDISLNHLLYFTSQIRNY